MTLRTLLSATALGLAAAGSFALPQDGGQPAKPSIPGTPLKPIAAPKAPRPELLQPGTTAPDFEAIGPNGPVRLSSLKGKVVILDFWATWCGPCMRAMPHLQEIYSRLPDNAAVLAVCVSDTREAYDKWTAENKSKYTFPMAFDPAGRDRTIPNISRGKYNVSGIPTTYVIGADGKVIGSVVGYGPNDHRLDDLLKANGVVLK